MSRSKIVSLSDDIKLNLAADISEAPIPGKAAIGIEVPNKEAGSVYFRELVESKNSRKASQQYHSELVRILQERLLLRILRRCRMLVPEQQVQVNQYVSTQLL
ncbi:MAG: DNA translocase FtsK [Lachnospira eligens]